MGKATIIGAAAGLLVALLFFEHQNRYLPRLIVKCLLSALFCAAALSQFFLIGIYARLIIAGLFLCLIGDFGLGLQTRQAFLIGLLAFLGAHLLYTAAFFAISPANVWTWGTLGATAAVSAGIYSWLRPHLDRMQRPVAAYIIIITMMVAAAGTVMGTPALAIKGRLMAFCGAMFFYLSDFFVARQRFVTPSFGNRLVGLPLYYCGQFLLAFSIAHLG